MILNDFQQIQKFTFVASAKSAELGREVVKKKQHILYFLQATVLSFFFTRKTVKRSAIIVLHFFSCKKIKRVQSCAKLAESI